MYEPNLSCLMCGAEDTQEHLLNCKPIIQNIDTSNIDYSDLFSNIEKQVKATKVFMKLSRSRTFLNNFPDSQGSQAHLLWCLVCINVCIWYGSNIYILIKMFVINLLLNKILCAAFGAWPSRPPPSYPSMSHLNIMKNLGSGLDPLPPFGTMSHISVFFLFEGIPNTFCISLLRIIITSCFLSPYYNMLTMVLAFLD